MGQHHDHAVPIDELVRRSSHIVIAEILEGIRGMSTRQIAETTDATGLPENETAAKTGGRIAKRARLELEAKTGQKVVTGENYLPPKRTIKQIKGGKQ